MRKSIARRIRLFPSAYTAFVLMAGLVFGLSRLLRLYIF